MTIFGRRTAPFASKMRSQSFSIDRHLNPGAGLDGSMSFDDTLFADINWPEDDDESLMDENWIASSASTRGSDPDDESSGSIERCMSQVGPSTPFN